LSESFYFSQSLIQMKVVKRKQRDRKRRVCVAKEVVYMRVG
jgi:hypothetical protein